MLMFGQSLIDVSICSGPMKKKRIGLKVARPPICQNSGEATDESGHRNTFPRIAV
jgi:hypothetical protein